VQAEGLALVPVAEILTLIAVVALVVGMGLCSLIYRIAGGKVLIAVFAVGLFFLARWGNQLEDRWRSEDELVAWHQAARKACETEQATLPSELDARSLVDTTTGLLWTLTGPKQSSSRVKARPGLRLPGRASPMSA